MRTSNPVRRDTRQLRPSELEVLRQAVQPLDQLQDEPLGFARGLIIGCLASFLIWAALAGLIFLL